jgi:hypothetical protein
VDGGAGLDRGGNDDVVYAAVTGEAPCEPHRAVPTADSTGNAVCVTQDGAWSGGFGGLLCAEEMCQGCSYFWLLAAVGEF